VAKSVAHQLATAALWVRIQTSLKNHKWATEAKEWPTHSSPPKEKKMSTDAKIQKHSAFCRVTVPNGVGLQFM
jgi:hypothetical protein